MKKNFIAGLIIIFVLIVSITIGLILYFKNSNNKPEKNITNVISNIQDYGYSLDDRDSAYMKESFKELEEILNSEEIDYKNYAKMLSILFITDFYTLNNKVNKYDVGSLEYILNEKIEMFKTKAIDGIYKDIIDNTYKDRIQELPEITEVNILKNEIDKITINEKEEECYKVEVEFKYKKDLGYDNKGYVYLVKRDNKLEIAKYEPIIITE